MGPARRLQPEVMDQPDLCPRAHTHALTGLARINLLSGAAGTLFRPLAELHRRLAAPRLRVLDVATGGGDVPLRLWRMADRAGLDWRISGCDRSPVAVEHARAAALQGGATVHFFTHDALAAPLPGAYDAVLCSLFLHHLDENKGDLLLRSLARPEGGPPRLVLVSDLNRTRMGLWLAWLATRVLTRSPVVHTDGPRSVEAAFTPMEALSLAARAGLTGATVRRVWPFRWLLSWGPT
jgi:2-polyprenyl-3-methyl-5-hydroxy-6-metoxy-1,4-benzoquinol methylase